MASVRAAIEPQKRETRKRQRLFDMLEPNVPQQRVNPGIGIDEPGGPDRGSGYEHRTSANAAAASRSGHRGNRDDRNPSSTSAAAPARPGTR